MSKTGGGRRVRRGRREWSALVAEQASSGQSHRAFCESRGVSPASFGNAKRRIGQTSSVHDEVNDFVAIPMDTGCDSSWDVELSLGDGVVLRMRRG